ncbi:MAG TPA: hypothetical protein DEP82_14940 [Arthrobacter bacterium]|jgi:hypothetical protein|nr:hypothetical protein [Arthrobacter sp.]
MDRASQRVGTPTPRVLSDAEADALNLGRRWGARNESLDQRLWGRVMKGAPNECWPWTAGKTKAGYGQIQWQGQTMYVHRLAYTETFGPIPEGTEVDHDCHNGTNCTAKPCPHRACCNPSHLEAVTHAVNTKRGNLGTVSTSRMKTHCPQGHEYSADNTTVSVNARGWRSRQCRTCNRERQRRIRAK